MSLFFKPSIIVRRNLVLVASLLFLLVGTGSIYFIVVAMKQISNDFLWPRSVPSIAYALQYFGAEFEDMISGTNRDNGRNATWYSPLRTRR